MPTFSLLLLNSLVTFPIPQAFLPQGWALQRCLSVPVLQEDNFKIAANDMKIFGSLTRWHLVCCECLGFEASQGRLDSLTFQHSSKSVFGGLRGTQ